MEELEVHMVVELEFLVAVEVMEVNMVVELEV